MEHNLTPGNYILTMEPSGPHTEIAKGATLLTPGIVYFGFRRSRYGWEKYSWSASDDKGVVTSIEYTSRDLRSQPHLTLKSLHVQCYRDLTHG